MHGTKRAPDWMMACVTNKQVDSCTHKRICLVRWGNWTGMSESAIQWVLNWFLKWQIWGAVIVVRVKITMASEWNKAQTHWHKQHNHLDYTDRDDKVRAIAVNRLCIQTILRMHKRFCGCNEWCSLCFHVTLSTSLDSTISWVIVVGWTELSGGFSGTQHHRAGITWLCERAWTSRRGCCCRWRKLMPGTLHLLRWLTNNPNVIYFWHTLNSGQKTVT